MFRLRVTRAVRMLMLLVHLLMALEVLDQGLVLCLIHLFGTDRPLLFQDASLELAGRWLGVPNSPT